METFDINEAIEQIKEGHPIEGKDGVLAPLIKQLVETALEAELESHLAQELRNRKNGKSRKRMKSEVGTFELAVPRDRNGTFEPRIVKKHQTRLSDTIEAKILSLYALGNSYAQIAEHIEEMYGVNFSKATIGAVTDKIVPMLQEWRQRPLQPLYPFIWLDAIHYKIKEEGRFVTKAVYTVLGIGIDGKKEVLGLYVGESEGARFWMQVLNDLRQRGVEDILIASVDGLKGFPEAIASVFPKTDVQLCVIHQIRNSLKYVASKHQKAFMKDLKEVYRASTKESAQMALDALEKRWKEAYPIVIRSWRDNWEHLSYYFQFPDEIRKIIYTTNIIESVHRQFRKLTKTKGAFPNEESLLKLLYLGIQNAQKKWSKPVANWPLVLSQLSIFFEERLDGHLDL